MVPLNIGFKRKAIEDLSEAILCKRDSHAARAPEALRWFCLSKGNCR